MSDAILVLNAGSSSIKFALFGLPLAGDARLRGQIEGIGRRPRFLLRDGSAAEAAPPPDVALDAVGDHAAALDLLLDWLPRAAAGAEVVAAGHRVVHGGTRFTAPLRVTPAAVAALAALGPLAPHHQPHNVAAIRALAARRPDLPQVACFDTAFHATQPAEATTLPLPAELRAKGLRRYGFHGLSYEYVSGALAEATAPGPAPTRAVIAHLGNGASLCAVKDGLSVATTMGFSTLDGLIMGTRCGSLDPGVLLHLMTAEGYDAAALTELLYDRSGLLALSGESADMRRLLASERPEAREAVAIYCYRIVREIGALAAALGGFDAVVFTGGIGEHAAPVRDAVCRGCAWLGLALDAEANARGGPRLSAPDSRVAAWVVPTNEELVIARHTAAAVG